MDLGPRTRACRCAAAAGLLLTVGCGTWPLVGPPSGEGAAPREVGAPVDANASAAAPVPCASPDADGVCPVPGVSTGGEGAVDSPLEGENAPREAKRPRRIWANSFQWAKAPELVVEEWLTDEPDTKGKYVLIEFWNTWCPPCRRSISLLNRFHERFGDELVVIGICDEPADVVRAFKMHEIKYFNAVDTQARTKGVFGVFGVPHAVVLEPDGYVVWEGFPLLEGYELTEELVDRILAVGRAQKGH